MAWRVRLIGVKSESHKKLGLDTDAIRKLDLRADTEVNTKHLTPGLPQRGNKAVQPAVWQGKWEWVH